MCLTRSGTRGAAAVDRRTLGVVQAGAGGAAQPVDLSKEGQSARDELNVRLEANGHNGGHCGSHGTDGSGVVGLEKRESDAPANSTARERTTTDSSISDRSDAECATGMFHRCVG